MLTVNFNVYCENYLTVQMLPQAGTAGLLSATVCVLSAKSTAWMMANCMRADCWWKVCGSDQACHHFKLIYIFKRIQRSFLVRKRHFSKCGNK